MTAQYHRIRDDETSDGTVFKPALRMPVSDSNSGCDLCELWIARCLEKWCVNIVNFGRCLLRRKYPVICVNFGPAFGLPVTGHIPVPSASCEGRHAYA